jgi:hypothetical protein
MAKGPRLLKHRILGDPWIPWDPLARRPSIHRQDLQLALGLDNGKAESAWRKTSMGADVKE